MGEQIAPGCRRSACTSSRRIRMCAKPCCSDRATRRRDVLASSSYSCSMFWRRERRRIAGAPGILVCCINATESMQTLEEYKACYKGLAPDSLIQELFYVSQENKKLLDRNTKLETSLLVVGRRSEQRWLMIENLKTEIIHLKEKFSRMKDWEDVIRSSIPYNPDVVTTPRTDMLAWQNPYMIEEHTKKKNNASEST